MYPLVPFMPSSFRRWTLSQPSFRPGKIAALEAAGNPHAGDFPNSFIVPLCGINATYLSLLQAGPAHYDF
jgi:hypothetical protein